jgi:hypothetical protein
MVSKDMNTITSAELGRRLKAVFPQPEPLLVVSLEAKLDKVWDDPTVALKARIAELATLKPQPPAEGLYPWAIDLEPVARHAQYWIDAGRAEPDAFKAHLATVQGAYSWKNACYVYAERLYKADRMIADLQAGE